MSISIENNDGLVELNKGSESIIFLLMSDQFQDTSVKPYLLINSSPILAQLTSARLYQSSAESWSVAY